MTVVVLDGRLVSPSEAHVSVFDRGFLYGDAATESLRAIDGRLVDWPAHRARLQRSLDALGVSVPFDLDVIRSDVERAATSGLRAVRVVVTRGAATRMGLVPEPDLEARRVVWIGPCPPAVDGVRLWTVSNIHGSTRGHKLTSYGANLLALLEARRAGADDALLVDRGWVLEATTANVGWFEDGLFSTVRPRAGALPGLTRELAWTAARRLGYRVREVGSRRTELLRACEVVLLSSLKLAVSVASIDGQPIGDGAGRVGSLRAAMEELAGGLARNA